MLHPPDEKASFIAAPGAAADRHTSATARRIGDVLGGAVRRLPIVAIGHHGRLGVGLAFGPIIVEVSGLLPALLIARRRGNDVREAMNRAATRRSRKEDTPSIVSYVSPNECRGKELFIKECEREFDIVGDEVKMTLGLITPVGIQRKDPVGMLTDR